MHHGTPQAAGLTAPTPGAHFFVRPARPAVGAHKQPPKDDFGFARFGFDGFDIRPATTAADLSATSLLVRRMYATRGYRTDSITFRPGMPHQIVLAVWQGDEVQATVTLNRDSPRGLLCDEMYGEEIDGLRAQGRTVCELSRLAVDPDASSRPLLGALFRAAQQYIRQALDGTDAVVEVNPRHVRYYSRSHEFSQLGQLRRCPRVDAPAVLLHRELVHVVPAVRRDAPKLGLFAASAA